MMLSQETIKSIQTQIEQTELVNGWTDEHRLEVYQGSYTIFVSYKVLGEFTKEYSYHNEVSFNRYENLHHIDLVDAEILNIEAWDYDEEMVNIENLNEIQYYS